VEREVVETATSFCQSIQDARRQQERLAKLLEHAHDESQREMDYDMVAVFMEVGIPINPYF
jgi:hypothetical protein